MPRAGLPFHLMAGGARRESALYSTEGGWLHLETSLLVDDAARVKRRLFRREDQSRATSA